MTSMDYGNLHIHIYNLGVKKYPAKQHAQRVARHLGVSHGLIYLPGQHKLFAEDSDFYYPFRQRRYFYYLGGVDEPDCYMMYDIGADASCLYVPKISAQAAVWYGRGSTVPNAQEKYDFDDVRHSSHLDTDLQDWIDCHSTSKTFILHSSQAPANLLQPPSYDTDSLQPAIDAARVIKDDDEIAAIHHAVDVSSLAHATILHHITSLRSEAEIQGLFLDVCVANNAPLQAYETIVASGTNASILHYTADSESFEQGTQLVCLDAGAEKSLYASDITRTFPIHADGWPTKEAEDLYNLVAAIQEACIAALKPGVRFVDVFRLAQMMVASGLIRLGVLEMNDNPNEVNEFIETGGIYAFFPHGLGHHMALDMHDTGPIDRQPSIADEDKKKKPSTMLIELRAPCTADSVPLQAGMVITVEPGIYFNRHALDHLYLCHEGFKALVNMDVLERYIKVGGVRIEDDILITKENYVNLTTAPKGERMLEIIEEGSRCEHGRDCPYKPYRARMATCNTM